MPHLKIQTKARKHEYEIRIGRGLLSHSGETARDSFGSQTHRLALISNRKVFSIYGQTVETSLRTKGFAVSTFLIGDGERHKSLRTVEEITEFLSKTGVERTDGLVALGGGVVGDVAGFAASVYLRGIPYIQIPTTLVAQTDSSIGGKTGVNLPLGKNLVGTFHPPSAVIVDIETLATLPASELTAGWCECVKQGVVGSRKLFEATLSFLRSVHNQKIMIRRRWKVSLPTIARSKLPCCGDEREAPDRVDRRSRRVLNFGHTIGHALEAVTDYKRFRHGEAVGHGMLVAGQLSKNLDLLDESELELLRQAVSLCGPLPGASDIDVNALLKATAQDKKRTGDQIRWVLLENIGRPRIVDGAEISAALLRDSLRQVFRR